MKVLTVLALEVGKLRRTRVPGVTLVVSCLVVGLMGAFFWLGLHPGTARDLGLVGTKAALVLGDLTLDLEGFLSLVTQATGVGGLFLGAVATTFVFGREYVHGTAKVLNTEPVTRTTVVLAKLTVSFLWLVGLVTAMALVTWTAAWVLGLSGSTPWWSHAQRLAVLALLISGCQSLVAWVTVATRGWYMAPLGYAVFTLVLASLLARTGWGPWAPWSIVGLATGAMPGASLGAANYAVVALTFAVGTLGTALWERLADNQQ